MSKLLISLIQTPLYWEDKTSNLAMLQKKIESIQEKTELIIIPEMFSTGFTMEKESLAESMDDIPPLPVPYCRGRSISLSRVISASAEQKACFPNKTLSQNDHGIQQPCTG